MLSIYFSDPEAAIFYREVTSGALLGRASTQVRENFRFLSDFTATMLFIATYHKVTYYDNEQEDPTPVSQYSGMRWCILVDYFFRNSHTKT